MKIAVTSSHRRSYSDVLIVRGAVLCCALALVGSAAAALQPPAPSNGKHTQEPNASASKPASQSATEQRGTASSPLFIQSLSGPEREADAAHKKYEHHEKPTLDRWLTYSTVALALFTLLLFGFTAALWWVTLKLGRQAKADSERQATETQQSLAISKAASNAAVMSLRPWLSCKVESFGPLSFDAKGDAVFRFRFVIKNVGKTPAMSVQLLFPTLTLMAPGVELSILKLQNIAALSRGLGVPAKALDTHTPAPPGVITNPTGLVLFPDETYILESATFSYPTASVAAHCSSEKQLKWVVRNRLGLPSVPLGVEDLRTTPAVLTLDTEADV